MFSWRQWIILQIYIPGESRCEIMRKEKPVDLDGLRHFAGQTVDFINKSAVRENFPAQTDNDVSDQIICILKGNRCIPDCFLLTGITGGYIAGVNPFDNGEKSRGKANERIIIQMKKARRVVTPGFC